MAVDQKYGEVTVQEDSENPLNGTDEPVFIIRGRDAAAYDAVMGYAVAARGAGADEAFLADVQEAAMAIRTWQAENPDAVKVPD